MQVYQSTLLKQALSLRYTSITTSIENCLFSLLRFRTIFFLSYANFEILIFVFIVFPLLLDPFEVVDLWLKIFRLGNFLMRRYINIMMELMERNASLQISLSKLDIYWSVEITITYIIIDCVH